MDAALPEPTQRPSDGLTAIEVRGARQHNLKGIDLDIPRNKMTVCSGPSGSGKSSLAIDTLYAEGQRRYVESLSSYARQFLAPLQKPKVERITGLSPAISIEQKTTSKSPRSTVGTVTEIYDYLRILFARLGHPFCPKCGVPIGTQTADEIVEKVLHLPEGTKVYVMAPVERRDGERYEALWDELRASGFARVRVDGQSVSLDKPPKLSHRRKHKIEVVVDRAIVRRSTRSRLADSIESALDLGKGVVHVARVGDESREPSWPVDRYSQHRVCDRCSRSFDELAPHHFSFNSPLGWCPVCQGLGVQQGANPAVLVPDGRLSLRAGRRGRLAGFRAVPLFARMIEALGRAEGIDLDTPFDDLDGRSRRIILHGAGETWYRVDDGQTSTGRAEARAEPAASEIKGKSPRRRAAFHSSTRDCFRRSRKRGGFRLFIASSFREWSTKFRARAAWERGCATMPRRCGSRASRSTRSAAGRWVRPWLFSRGSGTRRRRAAHRRRPAARGARPLDVSGRRRPRLPEPGPWHADAFGR